MNKTKRKKLHLWLIIFFVSLLFTVTLWDYYLNSPNPINQRIVSNLALIMGFLFSVSASLFSWSVESARDRLEAMVVQRTEQLRVRNEELENALKEIKTLQGLIPMCAQCKKVRNDKGYWEQLEVYFEKHSDVQFTHGLCQTCAAQSYADYLKSKNGKE